MMELLVDRDDVRSATLTDGSPPPLVDGQVLVRVDAFALSVNNLTYARTGDALGYWQLFPAPAGRGRVPVWGFGEIVASRTGDVGEGRRIFGLFPPSSQTVMTPGRIGEPGFSDVTSARAEVHPAYNAYQWFDRLGLSAYPDGVYALLRPLFLLAFTFDQFLLDVAGSRRVGLLISSASSKAASALAFLAARRGVPVTGLTSAGHVDFVASLGVYDAVVGYEDVGGLRQGPTVFADVAGRPEVTRSVHLRLGDHLLHSATIGAAAGSPVTESLALPGPEPRVFFTPAVIKALVKRWGFAGYQQRVEATWSEYRTWAETWLKIQRYGGPAATLAAFRRVVDGEVSPHEGIVATLADASATPAAADAGAPAPTATSSK